MRAVYEGLEGHVRRQSVCSDLVDAGSPTLSDVTFYAGGDMVYHAEVMGLLGKFASKSGSHCVWCECTVDDLYKLPGSLQPDGTLFEGSKLRILKDMYHYAHLPAPQEAHLEGEARFPFTCSKCGSVFANEQVSVTNPRASE